jgi:cytochrome c oxidase assembly protein subunit 15
LVILWSLGFGHWTILEWASVEQASGYRWWLFVWAVLTAAAAFPLISLGGLVTSMRVGMADPEPVRSPWYLLTLSGEELSQQWGVLVEHSHRFLGWIVGAASIVLAGLSLAFDARKWMKGLGLVALLAVNVQGLLGIFRVGLESAGFGLELAMVHGVVGPLVFALFMAIAVMCSRSWWQHDQFEVEEAARFRRVSRLTTLMVVLQLISGVWLRQIGQDQDVAPLLVHLFFALAVIAHVLMLWVRVGRWRPAPTVVARPVYIALVLMGVQVLLGMAAWVYGGGIGARNQAIVPITRELAISATAHVAVGALLLAACVGVMLRAARHLTVSAASVATGKKETAAIGAGISGGPA